MPKFNRTKIVATVGPASNSKETLTALLQAGVDVFRLNFSHGTHEDHAKVIAHIIEANKELGTHVGILADLQGPKIRLGEVEGDSFEIEKGETVALTIKEQVSTPERFYINYSGLVADVKHNDFILLDDGRIKLQVVGFAKDEVLAKVIHGGTVRPRKGVNLPNTNVSIPALTPKDLADLEFILDQKEINWIALSFVRTADEILKLKGMIDYKNHPARVVAKIEKPAAIENIDEIIRVTDAIMVARGDLGVEMPLEQIPILQKDLVRKCIRAAKPVIIATQMMESMIENPFPTRAEVTDVANAIFDGADAIMLSGETAMGKYPVEVIKTFEKIIGAVEQREIIYHKNHEPSSESNYYLSDAICHNATQFAEQVNCKAIIGMTKSGYTAFTLASYRPKANIFVFTESMDLLNQVSLVWGVRAFYYDKFASTDETIRDVQRYLLEKGLIKKGDLVVNTGSMPLNQKGKTNMFKVTEI